MRVVNDVEEAMKRLENFIVVSNTSIQYWEMYEYVRLAQKYDYLIEFCEPATEWRNNVQILYEKNAHSVPLGSIKNQVENFKRNPTLPNPQMISTILATGGFRPTNYREGLNIHPSKFLYYGINGKELLQHLEQLKTHLGEEEFGKYNRSKCQRDGGPSENGSIYHITLTNFSYPKDEDVLSAEQRTGYFNSLKELKTIPKFLGVGRAESKGNLAYYVVIDWPEINVIRQNYNLTNLELHATLGFVGNDVHGIRKGPGTILF